MSKRFLCFLKRRLASAALALTALSALAPAHAQQEVPGILVPLWYATTVDLASATATFSIRFDRTPDLAGVDEVGRLVDQFQVWTDTVSTDPVASTYAGLFGLGPLGTQAMVTTTSVSTLNRLTYVWPRALDYTGPRDPGGWGTIEAYAPFTLSADNTVSFDVPLALLHAPDGHFNYGFQTYRLNLGGDVTYYGVSGREYEVPPVPEPSKTALLGLGMMLLGMRTAARRHGKRPGTGRS